MLKILNIICLLIWIGWFVYAILGTNVNTLRGGLICGSVIYISYYIQSIFEQLK